MDVADGANMWARVTSLLPVPLLRATSWLQFRGLMGNANLLVSNVRGPREPFYVGPMEVVNWFSTGQIFDGTCINMTMWSYCQNVNLCVLADKKVLPDGWKLFDYFVKELEILVSLIPETATKETTEA